MGTAEVVVIQAANRRRSTTDTTSEVPAACHGGACEPASGAEHREHDERRSDPAHRPRRSSIRGCHMPVGRRNGRATTEDLRRPDRRR
jgi:hypothetical protein